MVMTFTLTPLSHYNSTTEPHARFLLSLMEDLSIDFPSHFITSIIDVYQDIATYDKLIFTFPFLSLLFSPLWVPSTVVLFGRVRLIFD